VKNRSASTRVNLLQWDLRVHARERIACQGFARVRRSATRNGNRSCKTAWKGASSSYPFSTPSTNSKIDGQKATARTRGVFFIFSARDLRKPGGSKLEEHPPSATQSNEDLTLFHGFPLHLTGFASVFSFPAARRHPSPGYFMTPAGGVAPGGWWPQVLEDLGIFKVLEFVSRAPDSSKIADIKK